MRKLTLKMEGSVKSNIEFLKYPHSAIICGQTNCGKTVFVLDLLQNEYKGMFENIVIQSGTRSTKTGARLVTCATQKRKT